MGPASRGAVAAPFRTTEFPSDAVCQGGEPDRCPEGSGKRLLLTEAQMDINDYWPCKHFSANLGLSCGTPIQVSEWEGLAHPLPSDHPGSLGSRNYPPPPNLD